MTNTVDRTPEFRQTLKQAARHIINLVDAAGVDYQNAEISATTAYRGSHQINFAWIEVDKYEDVLSALQEDGFVGRWRHSKVESHRVFHELSKQLDNGLTLVIDLEFNITDPQPSAQFKLFLTHSEGGSHVNLTDSDYSQRMSTYRTERNKPVTESRSSKTMGRVVRQVLEAVPDQASANIFKKIVRDDIIATVLKISPELSQIPEGNRTRRDVDQALGDFYIAFKWDKQDIDTNKERVTRIGAGLRRALGLVKVTDPYPRRATAVKKVQQGNAFIQVPVWCQDLMQPLNAEYQGTQGTTGYGFDVQINAAKTTLSIEVRFTGKAL